MASLSVRLSATRYCAVADQGFAKGEGAADHGESAERKPKRESGGGASSGVQGQSGGGRGDAP